METTASASPILDARRIAAAVIPLELDRLRNPRQDEGARAALRVFVAGRDWMTTERTAAINELTAFLRAFALRIDARMALTSGQIAETARWHAAPREASLLQSHEPNQSVWPSASSPLTGSLRRTQRQ